MIHTTLFIINSNGDTMDTACPSCNGTGQISYFQGESRFLLSYEECPDCYGTGLKTPGQNSKDDSEEKQEDE